MRYGILIAVGIVILAAPLQWILMQAFGYVCKLHNWVTRKMMESLMKED